jgi:hypothetical protein
MLLMFFPKRKKNVEIPGSIFDLFLFFFLFSFLAHDLYIEMRFDLSFYSFSEQEI